MRKFFTMLLCAVLTVSLMIPAAAADVKAYADAADGNSCTPLTSPIPHTAFW